MARLQSRPAVTSRFWPTLIILATIAGAGWWALYAYASSGPSAPSQPGSGKAAPPATPGQGEPTPFVIGHGDIKGGVVALNPTQLGRVVSLKVSEYEYVKKGQELLQIDDRSARFQLDEARTGLRALETKLEDAKMQADQHKFKIALQETKIQNKQDDLDAANAFARTVKQKFDSTAANQDDLTAATKQAKGAEALLKAARTELEALKALKPELAVKATQDEIERVKVTIKKAELAVEECKLVAPDNGQVIRLLIAEGEIFAPQRPQGPAMFFVPEGKPIVVRAEAEQEFADSVKPGMVVDVWDDTRASRPHWTGKISTVSNWYLPRRSILLEPRQFNDVRTLECIIDLEPLKDGEQAPRIGQRLRVRPR